MYIFNKKNYLKSSESKKASQRKMNSNPVEAKRRVTFERLCMKIKDNLDVDLQVKRTENKSQMCAVKLLILSQKIWSERINQSVNLDKENR